MSTKDDLQSKISRIESFANGIPREDILKFLIESDILDVLVIGRAKNNDEYKVLLEAVKVYCTCYESNIKLHFADGFAANDNLNKLIHFYELDNNVDFVGEGDNGAQLSYYLGSNFALFMGKYDEKEEALLKAQYFYLPILVVNTDEETENQHDILQLQAEPTEIAAAFKVLKNSPEYGKRLAADSRYAFNGIAGN